MVFSFFPGFPGCFGLGVLLLIVAWAGICDLLEFCMISEQALLAFSVSGEKSGVILIGLPLYVT